MIRKDMTINEVLRQHPETIDVFKRHNWGCLGCSSASGETIEQAAHTHGISINQLLRELNEVIK